MWIKSHIKMVCRYIKCVNFTSSLNPCILFDNLFIPTVDRFIVVYDFVIYEICFEMVGNVSWTRAGVQCKIYWKSNEI